MDEIRVGLRIDVDTLRGTRDGVPALVNLLRKHDIKATFFMSVGPDNMGRNLWRLLKPTFFMKMLRSNGASLYGYDILLRGTCWPGPIIGDRFPEMIRLPQEAGHEVGLHAWDHFTWQASIDRFSRKRMERHLQRGFDKLSDVLGRVPTCSAAAGWRCNNLTLQLKEHYRFTYNSDCRGTEIFLPVVDGQPLTPQLPVTLPTYDEVIGTPGVTQETFNAFILDRCKPEQLNIYTIHAEVEGMVCLKLFEQMIVMAKQRNIQFIPLNNIWKLSEGERIPRFTMNPKTMPGREGWLAYQGRRVYE